MSALAGVYAPEAPPRRGVLERISAALAVPGPDGEHAAASGPARMVFRPFHTDAASRLHPQPLETPDGFLAALDGRIDDAGRILRRVPAASRRDGAAVALAAYRHGGVAALGELVGDWALAIWDPAARRLVLAADSLGRRPLYFHHDGRRLFWATRARALLHAMERAPRVDEEFAADFLANRPPDTGPFCGIGHVPGGHALVAGPDGHRLERYWTIDPHARVEHATDAGYEEHFAALLDQAVACRLAADGPVACELSGGVDSTSIACAADRLIRAGRAEAPALHTVSYVYRGSGNSDETPYVRAVERHLGRAGTHLDDERFPLLAPPEDGFAHDLPTNGVCFAAQENHVVRLLHGMGTRVVLSGIGGDQLFWSQPSSGLPLADLLARGRVAGAVSTGIAWSRWQGITLARALWSGGIEPFFPRAWQARRRVRPGEWLDRSFARRTGMADRMLPMRDDAGFRTPSTSKQYGIVRRSWRAWALEHSAGAGYLDYRYPYLDRRLVEFALAIPLDQKARPGESRSVVRRALAGRIPGEVRGRVGKAGPAEAFHRALAREWPRLAAMFAAPRVAELGFVDAAAFRAALERARHGMATHQAQLNRTLSLEIWLRSLDAADPPAPSASRREAGIAAVHGA